MDKKLVTLGAVMGSFIGGFVPGLWHAGMFSLWGIVFEAIGGLAGIWLAFRYLSV